MDKPGANPDHVKQQLAEHELIPEEWAVLQSWYLFREEKKKVLMTFRNDLISIEVQELKANANREARGVVLKHVLIKVVAL